MRLQDSAPLPITIDVSGVASLRDLHAKLARGLSFPAWYGQTWDAFSEGLADLPGQVTLVLKGGRPLQQRLPQDMHLLHEVLANHASEHPECAVALVLED